MPQQQVEHISKNMCRFYSPGVFPKKNRTKRNYLMISGTYVEKKALQIGSFVTGVFCCNSPSLLNCYALYGLKSGNGGYAIK